jgi:hypothetical protein
VKHCCLKHLASHTSDQRLLHFLGTIHDVEALGDSWSMSTVIQRLLASHWPHLSLVLEWFGGIMLHVNLQGNCTKWLVNPLHLANGDHALWEPHFSSSMLSLHSNDFSPIQGPTSTAVLSQPTCTGQSFWAVWPVVGIWFTALGVSTMAFRSFVVSVNGLEREETCMAKCKTRPSCTLGIVT